MKILVFLIAIGLFFISCDNTNSRTILYSREYLDTPTLGSFIFKGRKSQVRDTIFLQQDDWGYKCYRHIWEKPEGKNSEWSQEERDPWDVYEILDSGDESIPIITPDIQAEQLYLSPNKILIYGNRDSKVCWKRLN